MSRWNDWVPLSRFTHAENRDPLDSFRRELGRLFFDFERGLPDFAGVGEQAYPHARLEDSGSAYVLRAEVPGLSEKELELNVDAVSITLKGERNTSVPEGYAVHRRERSGYRFARSFALPTKVDAEKVDAVLSNGILTVTVPKAQEAQPRKIDVRAS